MFTVKSKALLAALSLLAAAISPLAAQEDVHKGLSIFRTAYPDVTFAESYDAALKDWKITITVPSVPGDASSPGTATTLYWANGSLLPAEELDNREKYWTLLYGYPATLEDPANYTPEQTERIRRLGSASNRRNGAGTPMFFFDALYSAASRGSLEAHLKKVTFLGRTATVHERVVEPLRRVDGRIHALAQTDAEVQAFIDDLRSAEAYYWRIIAGTNRKSFHSLGIAVDIQPKRLGGKAIYWSWTKDKDPDGWMLTPLKDRWMPPEAVIAIFEDEGFIWGGKWVIFDNMHFEYHPELTTYNAGRRP